MSGSSNWNAWVGLLNQGEIARLGGIFLKFIIAILTFLYIKLHPQVITLA